MASQEAPVNPPIEEIKQEEAQVGANRPPTPIPTQNQFSLSMGSPCPSSASTVVSSPASSSSSLSPFSSPSPRGFETAERSFRVAPSAPPTPPAAYTHHPPTSNHPNIPSLNGLFDRIPVQQHFSGPAVTIISVFSEPGRYNIQANFQPMPGYDLGDSWHV